MKGQHEEGQQDREEDLPPSEGVETMVPDHGFAEGGTMQVQAIMPPLSLKREPLGGFPRSLRRPIFLSKTLGPVAPNRVAP